MTLEEFEKHAARAIRRLPKVFRDKMQNVVVLVSDARRSGLLGLYEGIPLLDRTAHYSGAMPDKITLFKKNIESDCGDQSKLEEKICHVVMHEIAHHFGISDAELKRKNLY